MSSLAFRNSKFFPHIVCVFNVFQRKLHLFLFKALADIFFENRDENVFCAVRTGSLNKRD